MSTKTRKQASLASVPLLIILLSVVFMALAQLRGTDGELTPVNTLIVTTVLLQIWNLIDLLVLDWFILMTLRPRFMILPGTEGLSGYHDYRFHFQKFLNSITLTLIFSGLVTAVALGVEMRILSARVYRPLLMQPIKRIFKKIRVASAGRSNSLAQLPK